MTGLTSGGKPYRVEGRLNIKELISRTRFAASVARRDIERVNVHTRENKCSGTNEEVKTPFIVYFSDEITAHQVTFRKV